MKTTTGHDDTQPDSTLAIPRKQKTSFCLRLGFTILFLNLLMAGLLSVSLIQSRNLYEDRAALVTRNLSTLLEDSIHGVIDKLDLCITSVKYEAEKHLSVNGFDRETLDPYIRSIHSLLSELESIRIADANGDVIIGIGVVKKVNITDRDYFIRLRDDPKAGLVIAKPVISRMAGKWVLNIARRINHTDGTFGGVVFAQLTLEHFLTAFKKIDVGENGVITLRDSEMRLIVRHPVLNAPDNGVGQKLISRELADMLASGSESGTYFTQSSGADAVPRTISFRKISQHPLYIIVGRSPRDYLDGWQKDAVMPLLLMFMFSASTLYSARVIYFRWMRQTLTTLELKSSKDELEQRVARRTSELALKHRQLEELNISLEQRVFSSIAELRAKDKLMIQQSRQAAMGEMINNIAHQWKQPINNLGLLIQNLDYEFAAGVLTQEDMSAEVRKCMDLISFMAQTIDDFRNFFREDKQKSTFAVRQSIARAIRFVSSSLKNRSIRITVEQGEDILINGYPNEYAQVLLNLLGNARDVLLEREIADPAIRVSVFCEKGGAVVTVSDNGGGIPPDIIEQIFDPYFTTKEQGKGSGIGLFMSKTIIEQHMGGSLTVSNLDTGACFRIEIPDKVSES